MNHIRQVILTKLVEIGETTATALTEQLPQYDSQDVAGELAMLWLQGLVESTSDRDPDSSPFFYKANPSGLEFIRRLDKPLSVRDIFESIDTFSNPVTGMRSEHGAWDTAPSNPVDDARAYLDAEVERAKLPEEIIEFLHPLEYKQRLELLSALPDGAITPERRAAIRRDLENWTADIEHVKASLREVEGVVIHKGLTVGQSKSVFSGDIVALSIGGREFPVARNESELHSAPRDFGITSGANPKRRRFRRRREY